MKNPTHQYGDSPHEVSKHTFYKYSSFTRERVALEMEVGEFTPQSVVEIMRLLVKKRAVSYTHLDVYKRQHINHSVVNFRLR